MAWGEGDLIGLPRLRRSRSFHGLPIETSGADLVSGVAVVELASMRLAGLLRFAGEADEIHDLAIPPNARRPGLPGVTDGAHHTCLSPPGAAFRSQPSTGWGPDAGARNSDGGAMLRPREPA